MKEIKELGRHGFLTNSRTELLYYLFLHLKSVDFIMRLTNLNKSTPLNLLSQHDNETH